MDLILGVDGGGTGCRAALASPDGAILGTARAGAANIMSDPAGAEASILQAAAGAFRAAGLEPDFGRACAVLGLAGANVGAHADELLKRLPFRRAAVESDALIALEGALGPDDGAIAIVGTGTVFMGRRAGALRSLGGWGFRVGDRGGGARIGQNLLEEALLAHDGVRSASALSGRVLAHFGGPHALVAWAASASPGDFGGFAPWVFEHAEDALARDVLATALGGLQVSLRALRLEEGERLCLLGGLAPLVGPRLDPDLRRFVQPARADALSGAVQMAVKRYGGGTNVSRVTGGQGASG